MTYQIRESLFYRGREHSIRGMPLEGCETPLPAFEAMSSACWRGYIGTWEVNDSDDALYLIRLDVSDTQGDRDGLREMFPTNTGSVEATWYSGELSWESADQRTFLILYRGKLLLEQSVRWTTSVIETRLTRHVYRLFPSQEFGFLHAILGNPNDPGPRLIYADWLDDHGDERGQLLRRAVEQQKCASLHQRLTIPDHRHDIASGYVDPDEILWFWRWLAGVPGRTPEDRAYAELLEKSRRKNDTSEQGSK